MKWQRSPTSPTARIIPRRYGSAEQCGHRLGIVRVKSITLLEGQNRISPLLISQDFPDRSERFGAPSSIQKICSDTADRIERLVEGPYLELFARENRSGWDTWGNQNGLFNSGGVNTRRQPSKLADASPTQIRLPLDHS